MAGPGGTAGLESSGCDAVVRFIASASRARTGADSFRAPATAAGAGLSANDLARLSDSGLAGSRIAAAGPPPWAGKGAGFEAGVEATAPALRLAWLSSAAGASARSAGCAASGAAGADADAAGADGTDCTAGTAGGDAAGITPGALPASSSSCTRDTMPTARTRLAASPSGARQRHSGLVGVATVRTGVCAAAARASIRIAASAAGLGISAEPARYGCAMSWPTPLPNASPLFSTWFIRSPSCRRAPWPRRSANGF